MNATLRQPSASAAVASPAGDAASARVSISRDFEMSQFWQNLHARLQPAVPNDSTGVPGMKWLSGFFSIGSTQKPLDRPYEARTTWSSTRPRTKQSPRWPSCSRHARGQTSHWIRPSSRRCQCRVGTVHGSARLSGWSGVRGSVSVIAGAPRKPAYAARLVGTTQGARAVSFLTRALNAQRLAEYADRDRGDAFGGARKMPVSLTRREPRGQLARHGSDPINDGHRDRVDDGDPDLMEEVGVAVYVWGAGEAL